jgi:hypothetical protein
MTENTALDKLFERVENILDQEEKPTKMSREMRDAFMFYTAHHIREVNGKVKKHDEQLSDMKFEHNKQFLYMRIAIVIIIIVVLIEHPALRTLLMGLIG